MRQIDAWLAPVLRRWVDAILRHSIAVTASILLVTLGLAAYTATHLGVNTDGPSLFSDEIPARQNHDRFAALFPNLEMAFFVVIDAETPELVRSAAETLRSALRARPELYDNVYLPGGGDFFERNGLLYRSIAELDVFADQMARMQPLIAELRLDPELGQLTRVVQDGLAAVRDGVADAEDWPIILDRVGRATTVIYDEFPVSTSWEEILLRGSDLELSTRRVLVVHANIDTQRLLLGREVLEDIRAVAAEAGLVPERGVRVRVTGNPALQTEEFLGLAWDLVGAGILCFGVVVLILYRALRSMALVTAAIVTLLSGLIWTAAFAAFAVGHLNVISIAFGVLFIGLGVDFQIHLGMRLADLLRNGTSLPNAVRLAVADVGSSQVLCALTTAVGFLVFVPTDYLGVAELGLISGAGMLIILFLTLTFFPSLLCSVLPVSPDGMRPLRFEASWWRWLEPRARAIRWGALVVGVGAAILAPQGRFDANVIRLRDPGTESVQAFNELLESSGTSSPWFLNAVAPDLEEAGVLAQRLDALPVVSQTVVLSDYVPEDQDEKLEILADVSFLLDQPPTTADGDPVDPQAQVDALRELHDFLDADWVNAETSPLGESMRALRQHLAVLLDRVEAQQDPVPALQSLEDVLLGGLPRQLDRLFAALEARPITLDDLPPTLKERMLTRDGQARIQIFPSETLRDEASFARFTDSVHQIAPDATGVSANLLAFGRATQRSFEQAVVSAAVAIALLLFLLWRRVSSTCLVMAPLLLSSLGTAAVMVLLDVPWNFGNILVLPLLIGIGVDSGIHLVHRSEVEEARGEALLGTTTARAVFYSALTTTVSFGSLALSSHLGMKSLGIALSLGMAITVVSNLVVLPALLEARRGRDETDRLHASSNA